MNDTSFHVAPERLDRLAVAYAWTPSDERRIADHPRSSRWANAGRLASGGGGLISTVDDYLTFARLLLGRGAVDGVRLLSPKSISLMMANYMSAEDRLREVFNCRFFAGQHYGLGLAVTDDVARRERTVGFASLGSFWWGGVYGTSWLGDVVEEMIPILMTQLQGIGVTVKLNRLLLEATYSAVD
jgi:CubicO group peptidase (beta-lactamase class C family)